MTTPDATRRPGWLVRMVLLWALTALVLTAALWLTYDYAVRVVEINRLYHDSDFPNGDFLGSDVKWQIANSLVGFFTPLYAAGTLLLVLVLIVHARGWQVTRGRARAATPDRPAR